jgi:hypothetical protein
MGPALAIEIVALSEFNNISRWQLALEPLYEVLEWIVPHDGIDQRIDALLEHFMKPLQADDAINGLVAGGAGYIEVAWLEIHLHSPASGFGAQR